MKLTLAQGRLLTNGTGATTDRRAVTALAALGLVTVTGQSPDSVSHGYTRKWGRISYTYTLTAYGRMLRAGIRAEFRFGTGRARQAQKPGKIAS